MARAGGRELFYLDLDSSMMSVIVQATGEFKASPPARLFATNMAADPMEPQWVWRVMANGSSAWSVSQEVLDSCISSIG